MKLYYEIQDSVYIVSYDEIDEYMKNYFDGKDIPLHVPVSIKDVCPYLKDNNAKCDVICDNACQENRIYLVLDDFGTELLTKNHSILITHWGTIYTVDDDEIPGNFVEA